MNDDIKKLVNKYLRVFPDEVNRLLLLNQFLQVEHEIFDWNNFNGHITVGAFLYVKSTDEFLVLYHKDLKMFLYPGGHVDKEDANLLNTACRELKEETGIVEVEEFLVGDNRLIPLDIDIHKIPKNERLNLPEHYHFDFRYLFLIEDKVDIKIDNDEFLEYRWISKNDMVSHTEFGKIVEKFKVISKDE